MSQQSLAALIYFAGVGQLGILTASALVPIRLNWRSELQVLPRLHRQMYWVYGAYVVLSIIAFALISIANSQDLASGSRLARSFCCYVAIFWAARIALQPVFDVKQHVTTWWLRLGYHALTVMFAFFTIVYASATLNPAR